MKSNSYLRNTFSSASYEIPGTLWKISIKARYLSLPWVIWSPCLHILFPLDPFQDYLPILHLGFPNGVFSLRLAPKPIMPFPSFPCLLNVPITLLLFSFYFIIWSMFGEVCKLWRFSECIFLLPHVISFPWGQSTLLSTPLSIILYIYSFLLWHKKISPPLK